MGDSTEDFEPLFDYRRDQPTSFVFLDDDSSDAPPPIPSKKRQKTSKTAVKKVDDDDDDVKVVEVSNSKDLDEEDWLPPPPVLSDDLEKRLGESSTIKELRLKKQELESFVATSADAVLQAMEESVRRDLSSSEQASLEDVEEKLSKPPSVRDTIIITLQDKDGKKQFRLYQDETFERLFKKYADKAKLCMQNLVFIFDGDKVNPTTTPDSLGMEDEDIIEVREKKR